jgi:2-keto-4-pentenoate hydratase/2-oxohepta-3-ene-1,7-dioic acid hydratase in catechol pathway
MKLVSFAENGQSRLGALLGGAGGQAVIDLQLADRRLPSEMIAFLEGGPGTLAIAQQAVREAPGDAVRPLATVTLRAPVPRPGKIICIGQNYLEHAREGNASQSPYPIYFAKYNNGVIGAGEPIVIPAAVEKPDYEGELAVVIGRRARNVPEAEALAFVGGYTALNDVSARDWQHRTGQWMVGKIPDTFCPMGPALVTADEIPDPQNLHLCTTIGDEVLQRGYTGDMIFSIAFIIADLTRIMTLEPGDVIATGTPAGVGAGRTPKRWLKPGEVVRVEIEGIGELSNPVAAE